VSTWNLGPRRRVRVLGHDHLFDSPRGNRVRGLVDEAPEPTDHGELRSEEHGKMVVQVGTRAPKACNADVDSSCQVPFRIGRRPQDLGVGYPR